MCRVLLNNLVFCLFHWKAHLRLNDTCAHKQVGSITSSLNNTFDTVQLKFEAVGMGDV